MSHTCVLCSPRLHKLHFPNTNRTRPAADTYNQQYLSQFYLACASVDSRVILSFTYGAPSLANSTCIQWSRILTDSSMIALRYDPQMLSRKPYLWDIWIHLWKDVPTAFRVHFKQMLILSSDVMSHLQWTLQSLFVLAAWCIETLAFGTVADCYMLPNAI